MYANTEQNPEFILINKKWDRPIDRPTDGWIEHATKNLVMSALDEAVHQAMERYSLRLLMN